MVLETIINPITAERKPWELIFIGLAYSLVALGLSYWVFHEYISLALVFLTAMVSVPLIYNIINLEEKKDVVVSDEKTLLKEHNKVLSLILFLFLGFTITFAVCYTILPNDLAQQTFSAQTQTITTINSEVTGNFYNSLGTFSRILSNNIKVLVYCLIFAFIYGFGAIFILTWNASVIGVAIGNFIKLGISKGANLLGFAAVANYFHAVSLGFLRYSIHGIPEIAAYVIGGIAGSIISVAVVKHDFRTKKCENILLDSSTLIIIAVVILFLAAILEVYVTPLLF